MTTESWVSRAASARLKQTVVAITEAAYTLADNLDREVSLNEMIAAALRETINQCQNGQGVIYSHDVYAVVNELEAQPEADGPAVPDGREPTSVVFQPTDEELLALMPETMRDEFSYAAKTCSDSMGGRVKPGIFRVALNTAALEYARVVLEHYRQ